MGDLTIQQEKFCREYIITGNGTRSAIKAGYAEKSAAVKASELVRNPKIIARMTELKNEFLSKNGPLAEFVIQQFAKLAGYDLKDFVSLEELKVKVGEDFQIMQSARINPDYDGTVATGLHNTKDGLKLSMPDRNFAMDKLARILGLYNDNVNVDMRVKTFEEQLSEIED